MHVHTSKYMNPGVLHPLEPHPQVLSRWVDARSIASGSQRRAKSLPAEWFSDSQISLQRATKGSLPCQPRAKAGAFRPPSSAICKLRNSVGPRQYFSVYQGGLCVRLVGSETGNEDWDINSLCKQHLQGLQSPIWGCSPPGWEKKKKRRGKSQTGNAMKGDESRSIKRATFGLKSCL